MAREEWTVRLAAELAAEMDRGVRNPDRRWVYRKWLRRCHWELGGYGGTDIKPYDLTLERQARYAIDHYTADDLRRQARELLAATGKDQTL